MIISKRCVMAVMPFCYDFQPSDYSIYVEKILYIKEDLSIPTHHPFNVAFPYGKAGCAIDSLIFYPLSYPQALDIHPTLLRLRRKAKIP